MITVPSLLTLDEIKPSSTKRTAGPEGRLSRFGGEGCAIVSKPASICRSCDCRRDGREGLDNETIRLFKQNCRTDHPGPVSADALDLMATSRNAIFWPARQDDAFCAEEIKLQKNWLAARYFFTQVFRKRRLYGRPWHAGLPVRLMVKWNDARAGASVGH